MNRRTFQFQNKRLWAGAVATVALIVAAITVAAPILLPPNVSINSTSQNSSDVGTDPYLSGPVTEQPFTTSADYQIVTVNDLGMHCGDYDTRIASILPPFQVLVAQVIRKGGEPDILNPSQVDVFYSAASNPNDPILSQQTPDPFTGCVYDANNQCVSVYKTNFWDVIASYDPFYPAGVLCNGSSEPPDCFLVPPDQSLPVPNVEHLYIGPDGKVNSGDESLTAVQHAMPGIAFPYQANDPQRVEEYYKDKPFFVNFPFGYVADELEWFEGAGIPFAAFDDFGRENAYPLVRVQAKSKGGTTLASVDTVLPISGEASCKNCHASTEDVPVSPDVPNAGIATQSLATTGLPVALAFVNDPEYGDVPTNVSIEYATDINILRLHDLKHGAAYVDTAGAKTPCTINSANPDGNANCLINKALVQGDSVVCQVCHYTPALDLAQLGPLGGDASVTEDPLLVNGRVQRAHESNSAVMHYHHGTLVKNGQKVFPDMPAPVQNADGDVTNQAVRLAVLEQTCYQCHPGTNTQCLRGAMFNGGMLCNDCHGSMEQVGNDFSRGVSPSNPNDFQLGLGNFYDPNSPQPRVPCANEPGCGSCHTGDALNNLAGTTNTITNVKDVYGNSDGIRLIQAFRTGDAKATPIVPDNKLFAENTVDATFNGFANPGAGNPRLYRVSTGHGGVFCEGCHGSTHAEWPNGNPFANDNVTANQLQGHTGTVIECSTCHGSGFNPSDPLDGPHGLHVVGDTKFSNGGHENFAERNLQACASCHGDKGQGTVLSRAAVARTLSNEEYRKVEVAKGQPISCNLCHENPFTGRDGEHERDHHEDEHHGDKRYREYTRKDRD